MVGFPSGQEPMGLLGSLTPLFLACHGLWTPADLHTLARRMLHVGFGHVKTLAVRTSSSRSCTSTSGSAASPTAYRMLCLRLVHLVRHLSGTPPWTKARYGWVLTLLKMLLSISFPTGTFTLQDAPSLSQRDNVRMRGGIEAAKPLTSTSPRCRG